MPVKCPVCKSKKTILIFKKSGLPIYNLERHLNRESALNAKKGNVAFYFCLDCQFAFNKAVDSSLMDYLVDYESSRSCSQYFTKYLYSICREIDDVFSITDKTVVEIGCGDGDFLIKMREQFEFDGWGFDPSLSGERLSKKYKDLKFMRDYYSGSILEKQAHLVILRHVLEHQGNVTSFLDNILSRENLFPSNVYVEVPGWEWIVEHDQVYAFSYEHCSYFSKNSLEVALKLSGYKCKRLHDAFAGEYLQYYGSQSNWNDRDNNMCQPIGSDRCDIGNALITATYAFINKIPIILERLENYFEEYKNAVLWGAAGKGTMLLNILNIDYRQFPYVVDSNTERYNTYIPVTGQEVVAPNALKKITPDYVLITNPSYAGEIERQLHVLGVNAKIKIVE